MKRSIKYSPNLRCDALYYNTLEDYDFEKVEDYDFEKVAWELHEAAIKHCKEQRDYYVPFLTELQIAFMGNNIMDIILYLIDAIKQKNKYEKYLATLPY